ncbi:MAG TPA: copper chaperone PCu(A)C [Stellaceae bacterium]|nr:copper chaperone PCu(A)C [Stellaceae bacterium]
MRRALLILVLLLPGVALADPAVSIDGAWCQVSRVKPDTAVVYLTMTLEDEETDQLVGVETPVAGKVDILALQKDHGRSVMRKTASITLDAAAPTVFQPQDTHLVLTGITQKLAVGDTFPLTLEFSGAGKQDVTVMVVKQPPSAGMPDPPKGVKME